MEYEKIDLSHFPKEREEKLRSIYRYSMFDVMFYRSNLWMHTHRVMWLVEDVLPIVKKHLPDFDIDRARILALMHDDAEMIIGDIQAGAKAKMSEEELKIIEDTEREAVRKLASVNPSTINNYLYSDVLNDVILKDSVEAKLVSYMDKLDGFCESLHEIFAGNISLLRSVLFYNRWTTLASQKFPELKILFDTRESVLFSTDERGLSEHVFKDACIPTLPYTTESIQINTDITFYNRWRKIVMEKGGEEGKGWLITQKEFLTK